MFKNIHKLLDNQFTFFLVAFILGSLLVLFAQTGKFLIDTSVQFYAQERPILDNVRLVETKIENGVRSVKVIGEKLRNDCGPPIKVRGAYDDPLIPFELIEREEIYKDPNFVAQETPGIEGKTQDFGWWVIIPEPKGDFYLYVDYICGKETDKLYLRKSVHGPFNLRDLKR